MSVTDHDDTTVETPVGGVRWKRFGIMFGLTGAVTAGLIALTANGVLAADFKISGMQFTVAADHLHGEGFEQYAQLVEMIKGSPNAGKDGEQRLAVVSAIQTAELTNLCQSVFVGGGYLLLTAGDQPGKPVRATALVSDSDSVAGDAAFNNINVGQDASTLDKVTHPDTGKAIKGGAGVFGQQANVVDIDNLRQVNWSTTAARFTLPHLRMAFSQSDCP